MTRDGPRWSTRRDGARTTVVLAGDWLTLDASRRDGTTMNDGAKVVSESGPGGIAFDARDLGNWDSALLVFVAGIREAARARDIPCDESGLPQPVVRLLALAAHARPGAPPKQEKVNFVGRLGGSAIDIWAEGLLVTAMIGDTVLRGMALPLGRVRMRRTDLFVAIYEAGVAALPIVTVINVLVGGILAFVGSVQLQRFGAGIYIASLVGISMTREMAALMTAIVMAGRTGGAYAAHIATMQGSEEIDALNAIGIPIYDYLLMPRIIALTAMMPLLYLYGCTLGIFGGFIVSISVLNLAPAAFIAQTLVAVAGYQIVFGLVKSIAFGVLIAIAGCRAGLRAGRSAADVGKAATTAVVTSIVGVIALDAVFAVCANALNF